MTHYLNLDAVQLERLQSKLDDRDQAQFLFFRLMGPILQKRITQLVAMNNIPTVFIHGNPHLDNYAKTMTGAGMIDFDRSRLGPYVWDIVRFYASLALRQDEGNKTSLPKKVYQAFVDGYLSRLYNADLFYLTPAIMSTIVPKPHELSTRQYIDANIKWAKKMKKNPLSVEDRKLISLLNASLKNANQKHLLERYELVSAGKVPGSLGKEHYIVVLHPKAEQHKYDDILLDIKETYTERDDEWFYSPTEHHGLRMIKASHLYAPGVESRLSYCTLKKKQYWCREIPSFKGKLPEYLDTFDLMDVAYCVGTQLGRGHRRSCKEFDPVLVEQHFRNNRETIEGLAQFLNRELLLGYEFFEKSEKLQSELKFKKFSDMAC